MQRKSLFRRGLQSQSGMTLVEIMVVIAILGTLMSVVAFGVVNAFDDANKGTTILQMQGIEQSLQRYAAKKKGKYPTTSEGLEAAKREFADEKVPVDAWGNDFLYFSPGSQSGAPFEIISLGKDGAEGGEGANADIKSWDLEGEGD